MGMSWWPKASMQVVRTRSSNCRNVSSGPICVRSTSVLTKKPSRSSTSGCERPRMGVPTTRSSWPE
ncbi:hypothetical protein COSO111634_37925 [Corallococcus soli]